MTAQGLKIANLDENGLSTLHALEEELGAYVIALEPQGQIAELSLAELSAKHLSHLQESERNMGLVLLAYDRALSS
jgi:hypothetical protein